MNFSHQPVLINEVCENLRWDSSTVNLADLTVGGGGHLRALLERYPRPQWILANDQDPEALQSAQEKLKEYSGIQWTQFNFRNLNSVIDRPLDRVLVDLGISSYQIDTPHRGFSFQKDGPLDMRMNPTQGQTAADLVLHLSERELADLFWKLGEEKASRKYARRIVEARMSRRLETTFDLIDLLGFRPDSKDPKGRHPLTRVFQALRMAVNDELSALQEFLEWIPEKLRLNGRLAIISFHSIEDRAVKWSLKGKLTAVPKKVIQASEEEARQNPRSRSAKLRIYEKSDVLNEKFRGDRSHFSRTLR